MHNISLMKGVYPQSKLDKSKQVNQGSDGWVGGGSRKLESQSVVAPTLWNLAYIVGAEPTPKLTYRHANEISSLILG